MKPRTDYVVSVYFLPHSYLGTIDVGEQDDPELLFTRETMAVSKKQAENNVRYLFFQDRMNNGHCRDRFSFVANAKTR